MPPLHQVVSWSSSDVNKYLHQSPGPDTPTALSDGGLTPISEPFAFDQFAIHAAYHLFAVSLRTDLALLRTESTVRNAARPSGSTLKTVASAPARIG